MRRVSINNPTNPAVALLLLNQPSFKCMNDTGSRSEFCKNKLMQINKVHFNWAASELLYFIILYVDLSL